MRDNMAKCTAEVFTGEEILIHTQCTVSHELC